MNSIIQKLKNEVITLVSFALALISMFIVRPDGEYLSYIDFRTIIVLFCLMIIVSGIREMNIFYILGTKLVKLVNNIQMISMILILLCFFSSMLITNDVSLITFVPFTIEIMKIVDKRKYLILIIVFETIAANIGSCLTPIGNPQNLYLYSLSKIDIISFVKLMLPYVIVVLILLVAFNFAFVKKEIVNVYFDEKTNESGKLNIYKIAMYLILFIVALFAVAGFVNKYVLFALVLILVLLFDKKNIRNVDYFLLLTFAFLFIFIGNISRVDAVNKFLQNIVIGKEVIVGVISSQVISNVPAAILLSKFSNNYANLIIGVNIGGLGTLIASMASLISYKFYVKVENSDSKKYIVNFTIFNILFLIILLLLYFVISHR